MDNHPIGVMDSGVGGLTVLRELQRLMPNERYLYYGDNMHCPFGNRSQAEMLDIIGGIMDYFRQKQVKAVVLACNTSSALLEQFAWRYSFPIFSIIAPVAGWVVEKGLREVGVIATAMTIHTQAHARIIHTMDQTVRVYGQASIHLAELVDTNAPQTAILREVKNNLQELFAQYPVRDVILGCTHYPIVQETFVKAAPGVRFIDPASVQVQQVRDHLQAHDLLASGGKGGVDIVTTGDPKVYPPMLKRLAITLPGNVTALD